MGFNSGFKGLKVSCRDSFKVQNASLEMLHELEAAAIGT